MTFCQLRRQWYRSCHPGKGPALGHFDIITNDIDVLLFSIPRVDSICPLSQDLLSCTIVMFAQRIGMNLFVYDWRHPLRYHHKASRSCLTPPPTFIRTTLPPQNKPMFQKRRPADSGTPGSNPDPVRCEGVQHFP